MRALHDIADWIAAPGRRPVLVRSLLYMLASFVVLAIPQLATAGPLDLRGHGGPVRSIALSEDGSRAITGSFDYSVMLWRIDDARAKLEARLLGHDAAVNSVALVPRAGRAISGSDDGTVGLWDLANSKLITRLEGHNAKVANVAVSPDGKLAASAGWDRTARLWDLSGPRQLAVLEGHSGNVNAVAFSQDGRTLFTASADGTVRRWNVSTGALERTLYKHGWGVNALKTLPGGGNLLIGGLNGEVILLDIKSGEPLRTLTALERPVLTLAVSPKHALAAAGSANGKIHLWSIEDWQLVRVHDNPFGPVWTMAITGDGRGLYYAGLDDFAIYWQVEPPKPFEPVTSELPQRLKPKVEASPGERYFLRKCSICHTLNPDDGNKAGPTLYGLFGRKAGTLPGYAYSDALMDADFVWNAKTISRLFEAGPQHMVPGTKMPLQQMTSVEERDALIGYLRKATEPDRPASAPSETPSE